MLLLLCWCFQVVSVLPVMSTLRRLHTLTLRSTSGLSLLPQLHPLLLLPGLKHLTIDDCQICSLALLQSYVAFRWAMRKQTSENMHVCGNNKGSDRLLHSCLHTSCWWAEFRICHYERRKPFLFCYSPMALHFILHRQHQLYHPCLSPYGSCCSKCVFCCAAGSAICCRSMVLLLLARLYASPLSCLVSWKQHWQQHW